MYPSATTTSDRANVKRKCARCRTVPAILVFLLIGSPGMAEPMFMPFTQHQADSIGVLLLQSKPDTNRVIFLIQMGQFYVGKKWERKIDHDSAFFFYQKAVALTKKLRFKHGEIRNMYMLGTIYAERSEVEMAKLTHNKGIKMSRTLGYIALEAEGWYYLARIFDAYVTTIPELIKYYQRSMDLYARVGNVQNQAYLWKTIADLNFLEGNTELSLKQLLECLRLYRSVNFTRLHHTYNMLAAVNRAMGNYQHALKYGLAAIERSRATKDTVDIVYFFLQLGWIHEQLNQYDGANKYHKDALLRAPKVYTQMPCLCFG